MAFRRFSRSRSRSFSRRRRSGGRLRPATQPLRWENSNFFFNNVAALDTGVFLNESVELVKIRDHVGTDATGRVFEQLTRRIEIGGVVFNYWLNIAGPADQVTFTTATLHRGIFLVSDRLDSLGQPSALPEWTLTQAPISVAPVAGAFEDAWPSRIHFRDCDTVTSLAGLVTTPLTNGNLKRVHAQGTQSLRLRRFLDDNQGLYFQFFHEWNDALESVLTVEYGVWGTLYYRWKF